jgi:lipopolysaccharide export LptBFGC system permease protein LptF
VQALRTLYRIGAAILFAAVLVQFGAAGYGAFYASHKLEHKTSKPLSHSSFEHGFSFHRGFGYVVFIVAVIVFALALASRLGRPLALRALAAGVLVALTIILAWAGEGAAAAGIFHPLLAVGVFATTGLMAHHAWRGSSTWAP